VVATIAIVNDDAQHYDLAAILATGEVEELYSGLSVLVSAAADGKRCAALAKFRALALLLDPDLARHAQEPNATPSLTPEGRETFARSLAELRDTALDVANLTVWACAASVETMGLGPEPPLEVMSTPRFLRATDGARLIHV
jgi:peroxiredoxin family protein